MKIRVVIADDNPDYRFLVRKKLSDDPRVEVVGEASSAAEATQLAADLQPHVVILDMRMPGGGGLEEIPNLKEVAPQTKLLAHSGVEDSSIEEALATGADMHVVKSGSLDDLVDAIEELVRG